MINSLKILFAIIISLNSLLVFSQSKSEKLFNNTVIMINKYSFKKGDFMGKESDSISKNVDYIVYSVPDSIISIEHKLDILHLMIYYQRYSSDSYRSNIGDMFMNKDTINSKDMLYFLPLVSCNYCNYDIKSKISEKLKMEFLAMILSLKEPYQSYYKQLINFTYATSATNSPVSTNLMFRKIIEKNILNDKCFKRNYSMFF